MVDRGLSRVVDRALKRWTNLDVPDHARLSRLGGTYSVTELAVEDGTGWPVPRWRRCRCATRG